jgi:hypothetical protein
LDSLWALLMAPQSERLWEPLWELLWGPLWEPLDTSRHCRTSIAASRNETRPDVHLKTNRLPLSAERAVLEA